MKCLDLEAGIDQQLPQSGLRVATKMIERAIERAVDRGHCRDEQQQGAVTVEGSPRGAQKIRIALDVLHDIDGDNGIGGKAVAYLVEVSLKYANPRIVGKSPLQLGDVVRGRLDKEESLRGGRVQNQLGDSADPCACLDDPFPQGAGEGVDDPVVVIGGLGDGIQLSARIGEFSDGRGRIEGTEGCNIASLKTGR